MTPCDNGVMGYQRTPVGTCQGWLQGLDKGLQTLVRRVTALIKKARALYKPPPGALSLNSMAPGARRTGFWVRRPSGPGRTSGVWG